MNNTVFPFIIALVVLTIAMFRPHILLLIAAACFSALGLAVHLTPLEKKQLDDSIAEYLAVPNEVMWAEQPDISATHPLIFFHVRKAGGSSLRLTIADAAKKANLSIYIACTNAHGNLPCDTYHFNPRDKPWEKAVFAGHFQYGEQHMLSRANGGTRELNFACLTNLREPVSRVASCLYYRHRIKCINNLSLQELDKYLYKLDAYGDSCLNEPFFIMSGIEDRTLTDHLDESNHTIVRKLTHLRGQRNLTHHRALLERLAPVIFDLSLQHVKKCVPVVLELPLSFELQKLRFPKLGALGAFMEKRVNENVLSKSCDFPSGEHLKLIQEHSFLETIFYNVIYKKVSSYIQEVYGKNSSQI
ncbi:hypothetical protein EON65_48895 [archaeon]|nr:MAG: hypothetical protein EON65_48895 [archaeon]